MKIAENAVEGMLRVAAANAKMVVADPAGDNPGCRNGIGTWICERCGADVRDKKTACEVVPSAQRWRIDWAKVAS